MYARRINGCRPYALRLQRKSTHVVYSTNWTPRPVPTTTSPASCATVNAVLQSWVSWTNEVILQLNGRALRLMGAIVS
jgi:hypothetical protein